MEEDYLSFSVQLAVIWLASFFWRYVVFWRYWMYWIQDCKSGDMMWGGVGCCTSPYICYSVDTVYKVEILVFIWVLIVSTSFFQRHIYSILYVLV